MEELPQDQVEKQVHNDPVPAEPEYTLEEIMREFGGWSKREDGPAKPETMPESAETENSPPPQTHDGQAPAPQSVTGDTIRFAPIRDEPEEPERPKIWTYKGEPAPQPEGDAAEDAEAAEEAAHRARAERAEQKRIRRLQKMQKHQQRQKKARRPEQPEHVFSSPEEAYRAYCKGGTIKLRLILNVILCLVSAAMLALCNFSVAGIDLTGSTRLLSVVMAAAAAAQVLLAYDVLLHGVLQCLKLQFDHTSLLALTVLVTVLDAVSALISGRIPFSAVLSLELTMALWGELELRTAKRKTMRAVCSMERPVAAVREEKAWHGKDCIFRAEADVAQFVYQLELPDATRRVMRVYAPVTAGLTLVLAILSALRPGGDFLWAWTAMLLAGFPVGALIAYPRPFSMFARRLSRSGAAVAGWQGARNLGGECAVAIEDADLFPPENVTLNGMKIYSDRYVPQIIGYAAAVVETAGSGLVPLFQQIRKNQNGRHYTVDTFRRYEGGGLGAEIGGDVVLMGSLAFMKLMRVRMPEGTRLRQAVYMAINGELAAVFALNYDPAPSVRAGLLSLTHMKGLLPILATRDFMITPQFLKHRYKLSPDRIEFPTVEERAHLSAPEAVREPKQGALMVRPSFQCFTAAVVGARAMRSATRGATAISVAGGVIGAAVLFLLTFIGSAQAVSAWNLLVYTLLWLLPTLLVTALGGRT